MMMEWVGVLGNASELGQEVGDFGILHDGTLVEQGPVNNVRHNTVSLDKSERNNKPTNIMNARCT